VCRAELTGLGVVRDRLADWAPPEPTRALVPSRKTGADRWAGLWAALDGMPAWAQVAAAVLVLGVSAGAANLRIAYNANGLSVRTGWSGVADAPATGQAQVAERSGQSTDVTPAQVVAAAEPAATRAELVALERELRDEIAKTQAVGPGVLREARTLIADSERRQENELALRIGTMAQDVRAQREADNANLNRWLGSFRTSADREARLTRDTVQSLAVRVSSQAQQR
jgi:hypothetical protein